MLRVPVTLITFVGGTWKLTGSFKKCAVHWTRHGVIAPQAEPALTKTTFVFQLAQAPPSPNGQQWISDPGMYLNVLPRFLNIKRVIVQLNMGTLSSALA